MSRLLMLNLLCCVTGLYSMEYNEKKSKKSFFSWVKNSWQSSKKTKKSKDKRRPIDLTINEDKDYYNFSYVKRYQDIQLEDIDVGEDVTIEEYYRQFNDKLHTDVPTMQLPPS